jgi:hypothetical protein
MEDFKAGRLIPTTPVLLLTGAQLARSAPIADWLKSNRFHPSGTHSASNLCGGPPVSCLLKRWQFPKFTNRPSLGYKFSWTEQRD